MLKDFYCAYHHNQILTNFCCCQNCLLPVCPVCIRLHSEQHQLNSTRPQYESINKIYTDIQAELQNITTTINKQSQQLVTIQKQRKSNNRKVKAKILEYRDRMMRQFYRMVENFEYEISQEIINDDQKFIIEMEEIDDELIELERQVNKQVAGLESEQSLKTVIGFLSDEKAEGLYQRIKQIQSKIDKMHERTITSQFEEQALTNMRDSIKEYIRVQIKKPNESKQSKPQKK